MKSKANQGAMDRRRFLQMGSAAAVAAAGTGRVLAAGDDSAGLYARAVPARKGLPKEWVKSLVQAGHAGDQPLRGSKADGSLARIGMTVGGIGCGTVYLSGDGRFYVWDIFNRPTVGVVQQQVAVPKGFENIAGAGARVREQDGASYVNPPTAERFPGPFRQEFSVEAKGVVRRLREDEWADISFDGKWPVGEVRYADPAFPLRVSMTAWTPFIPLQTADSSLPVTVVEVSLENPGTSAVEAKVTGLLENPCCVFTRAEREVERTSAKRVAAGVTMLCHGVRVAETTGPRRDDVVFADFEGGYAGWTTEGTAFGKEPVKKAAVPPYQGDLRMQGGAAVNSHASAPGDDVAQRDAATGTLTSPEFTIERKFIRMLVGGGNHAGKTCVNLLVDGKVVRSVTGPANNAMREVVMPTGEFEGKRARLQAVDAQAGGWGNIGLDHVVFSDRGGGGKIDDAGDFGTMALCLLGEGESDGSERVSGTATVPAGGSRRMVFLLAWHFPNLRDLPGLGRRKRHYAKHYADAAAVASEVAGRIEALREGTMEWVKTWYDSTLPRWILDRATATSSTLQTENCVILDDGRFWAWEGVGCCAGTCAHVWHYAQGPARLFPDLERNLREVTDFGVAMNPNGSVRFRAEASGTVAIDAQTGIVLRTWREHLCSADGSFLKRVWPGAKKAMGWLLEFDRKDPDGFDGLLHGEQHNTLDAEWYGKVHALCSMYLAALRAGEEMAKEAGDAAFAGECRQAFDSGSKKIAKLFNGEFYEQEEDPKHLKAIGVGKGCYIDQVIGQWWACQTGLGRIADEQHIRSALHSLWRYNFVPDVGPFRQVFTRGRFYALPGDAGLVMCTWPKGGLRPDFTKHWQYAYFNECMSGFEWQAAAHMVYEGGVVSGDGFEAALEDAADPRSLTLRGLAVARAIHDRYLPAKRNPYNEIECSDHYARAAASYSLLLAVSGFHYHGPKGIIGFEPKLGPEDFRVPFVGAEGWGTFQQKKEGGRWSASLQVRHGRLRLSEWRLPWLGGSEKVTSGGKPVQATAQPGKILFPAELLLPAGSRLEVT